MEKKIITGHEPAFPTFKVDEDGRQFVDPQMAGISIMQHFALNAPAEIPSWFVHKFTDKPKDFNIYSYGLSEQEIQVYRSWQDSEEDVETLPKKLQPIVIDSGKIWDQRQGWEQDNTKARYFQWRVYYATQMIQALNLS